jgi:hypothetical protein
LGEFYWEEFSLFSKYVYQNYNKNKKEGVKKEFKDYSANFKIKARPVLVH